MLGRPAPLWILAVLGTIGGLLCTIVVMQFAETIPWAGDEATYIGGRWTGVTMYVFAAAFFFASAWAWLTVKPWAHMVTILAALIGFFVPFISYMDNTDPRSSALAPVIVALVMLFMVFRPSTNRAMGMALAGQGSAKAPKAPPPPKPMSAARKRELAREQKQAAAVQQASAPAAPAPAPASATAAATATAAVGQAVSSMPKPAAAAPVRPAFAGMAKSAAAMLGKSSPGTAAKRPTPSPVAPPAAAAPAAGAPASPARPRGFRADEV